MDSKTAQPQNTVAAQDALRKARARLRENDPRGAINLLKAAAASEPESAELLELLGVAHGIAGNTRAARAAFEGATRADPSRATAHYNYALVLARDGELELASEEANAAVYLDPCHSGAVKLRNQLAQQIRDRRYIGEQKFQTVGKGHSPEALRSGLLGQLTCGVCGKQNLFSARVCRHCGTFIKEMPDIVPVE